MSAENRRESACTLPAGASLPDWVPAGARLYLSHTAEGHSLRALARSSGCHASTVLRQVRRFENRRDDPLVDDALARLDRALRPAPQSQTSTERSDMAQMTCHARTSAAPACSATDLLSVLRQLDLPGAQLVVAPDMPKAMILRDDGNGRSEQLAVFDRALAEMLALKNWICLRREGRVHAYGISPDGLSALREQDDEGNATRRARYGAAETPISVLARRRDKAGKPFLAPALVQAADRLREDFVMAQLDLLGPISAERLTRALTDRAVPGPNIAPPGTRAARRRVLGALQDLGPGLSDMVLRVCCHLEGVESAEQAMDWCARSGKIVLRIGLQRLKLHYDRLGANELRVG